ncbi:MAG: hypothetical protein A4E64_01692 [Syntrophorhabdus sp. PtaU1.Bin058]|nr:MAG: hypothetical protein A4E64_01692 [Syntrophorhabdus sp. PtaU1.Bin058]
MSIITHTRLSSSNENSTHTRPRRAGAAPSPAQARPPAGGGSQVPVGLYSYSHNLHLFDLEECYSDKAYLFDPQVQCKDNDGYRKWNEIYITPKSCDDEKLKTMKGVRGKRERLKQIDVDYITDDDVYSLFHSTVKQQSDNGNVFILKNPGDKQKGYSERLCLESNSRWNIKGNGYLKKLKKRCKKELGRVNDPLMLTLTVQPSKVIEKMPEDTNLKPIAWFIMNLGGYINTFLKRLRQHQKRRKIKWDYVGYVLEMNDGTRRPDGIGSGWPNIHMIFRSRYMGNIQKIAELWDWSEPQGVDYTNRKKLEKKFGTKVKRINLVNYITKYVSKGKECMKDGKVHKSWAWVYFFGVRMYNLSHRHLNPVQKSKGLYVCIGSIHMPTGIEILFKKYKETKNDLYDGAG